MPFGDRTGPMGYGPMTGRAAGYCAGYDKPGYENQMPGRGLGRGLGRGGRGRRNWFFATGLPGWLRMTQGRLGRGGFPPPMEPVAEKLPKEQELERLKGQEKYYENELKDIRKRIEVIDVEPSTE